MLTERGKDFLYFTAGMMMTWVSHIAFSIPDVYYIIFTAIAFYPFLKRFIRHVSEKKYDHYIW